MKKLSEAANEFEVNLEKGLAERGYIAEASNTMLAEFTVRLVVTGEQEAQLQMIANGKTVATKSIAIDKAGIEALTQYDKVFDASKAALK